MTSPAHVAASGDTRPHTILGNVGWTDIAATTDIYIEQAGASAILGVRCSGNVDSMPGIWLSVNTLGSYNVTLQIANVGNRGAAIHTGTLPGTLAPNT
jgi:hypothetical protein